MLVLQIIATVFIGFSFITGIVKNIIILKDESNKSLIAWCLWSILWRAFIIVALWVR